jgi:hypothetical protein
MFETLQRATSNAGGGPEPRRMARGHGAEKTREGASAPFGPDASPFDTRRLAIRAACGAGGRSTPDM